MPFGRRLLHEHCDEGCKSEQALHEEQRREDGRAKFLVHVRFPLTGRTHDRPSCSQAENAVALFQNDAAVMTGVCYEQTRTCYEWPVGCIAQGRNMRSAFEFSEIFPRKRRATAGNMPIVSTNLPAYCLNHHPRIGDTVIIGHFVTIPKHKCASCETWPKHKGEISPHRVRRHEAAGRGKK